MTFLCSNCDREIKEFVIKYGYSPDLGNKIKKYTTNNIKFDEVDEILNSYIAIYIKDYDIYFVNCRFNLEFDNNFTTNIEKNYIHNNEGDKNNNAITYFINCYESMGYKFFCAKQMHISILFDKCNITYKNYINSPTPMFERRTISNIAKNPHLINTLDRTKNHPLIRKYSYIPFNNQ